MSKTYGDFYSLGIPGVGSDVYGTFYVTNDPAEMIKVIRQEGAYPYGAAEEQWLLKAWMKARNFTAGGIYGR
jgi:acetone carboxylase gamma subunit